MNFKQRATEIVATIRERGLCIDDLESLIKSELERAFTDGTDIGWAGIQDSMPQPPLSCQCGDACTGCGLMEW